MKPEELQSTIQKSYPKLETLGEEASRDLTFLVPASEFIAFCTFLKNDPQLLFENVMSVTAVDELERIDLVCHLNSYAKRHRITVKVPLSRENPKIPTLTGLWPGANWHERETFDLYGVVFEGHPDLRRILLDDTWEGHPMRKGYKHWNLIPLPDDVTEVDKDYPAIPPPMR